MIDIENAARAAATARQQTARAKEAMAEAQADADRVKNRVAVLQSERAGIIAAARNGDADPAHALRVGVIDADLADLAPLVADADAAVSKARGAVASAGTVVASAEQQLALATDEELQQHLLEHASRLDELLLATITELRGVWTRRRGRPTWAPSPALVIEITRLRHVADGRLAGSAL
ncbi:MAG: hypothetical protein ACLQJR_05735 [Stellaceae bacterium]